MNNQKLHCNVKRCYQRKPFKPISYERFRETRLTAGMSRKDAAKLLFVCCGFIPVMISQGTLERVFLCSVIPF